MSVIAEAEKLALSLSDNDRAKLADRLIMSLPADFIGDEEIAEARRRNRAMDQVPNRIITLDQLDEMIASRPRK